MRPIEKIQQIPDVAAKVGEFTLPEVLAISASREVRNDDIVFAGTGLPMIGILTAQCLHAPSSVLIYEAGIMDGKSMHIPGSVSDARACYMSSTLGGLLDTFGFYLQRGLVTLGFLGGASIDQYGGVNVTCIGDYYTPENRLTGSGGNADIGTQSKRVVFIMLQEKRRFVEKNEYTTTPGWYGYEWPSGKWTRKKEIYKNTRFENYGPAAVISNMGVYRFDDNGIMYLETYHPGVTTEKIKDNCSFKLNVSKVKGETPHPTYKQLFALREYVDPERLFLPDPPDYPPDVKKIINSFS